MGDYQDPYLTFDSLPLAVWLERLETVLLNSEIKTLHNIFQNYFFQSSPKFSPDMKILSPDMKILTDRNLLVSAGRMLRGGICSVYERRLFILNKKN